MEQAYELWAESYDRDENRTRDADARVLGRLLPPLEDLEVLEVGCGTGKNTQVLAAARRVLAIDLSPAMLARAREKVRAASVEFRRHDLLVGLPGDEGAFDLVTFDLVLEHVERLAPVLEEAARVLRDGGRVLVCEYHPFRQLEGRGARFTHDRHGEVRPPTYLHMVSEYLEAARSAGLVLEALAEWDDHGEPVTALAAEMPRLLSLVLCRPARAGA